MRIEKRIEGRVVILELSGKFSGERGPEDIHEIVRGVVADGYRAVLLDCRGLEWINSNGLGQVLACCHTLRREGGLLRMCELPQRAMRVFETCQVGHVLDIRGSRDEALAAFAADHAVSGPRAAEAEG